MTQIEETLVARLLAETTLTALVSDRIGRWVRIVRRKRV